MATSSTSHLDLPPLDFAYKVHTEIGHSCRGAKVNRKIVPLTYRLKVGDQVDILRQSEARPSRDWLNQNLGYLKTSRARAKVQAWFKQLDREQNVSAGKQLIDSEIKRLALGSFDLQIVSEILNLQSSDDLYAAIGAGDVRVSQVVGAVSRLSDQPSGNWILSHVRLLLKHELTEFKFAASASY